MPVHVVHSYSILPKTKEKGNIRSVFLITKFNQTKCLRDGLAESEEANRKHLCATPITHCFFHGEDAYNVESKAFQFLAKKEPNRNSIAALLLLIYLPR
jgi:hypothetical protein